MKRDLDLFRRILLDIEALPPGKSIDNLKYPEYEKEIVHEHIRLLKEASFIDANLYERGTPKTVRKYHINRLLNQGYDFLEGSSNKTAWAMTKEHFIKPGVSFSLELVAEYLKLKIKETLGMS